MSGSKNWLVIAPIVFGVQHRNLSVLHERLCVGAILRIDADANTDGNLEVRLLNVVGHTERGEYLVCTESGLPPALWSKCQALRAWKSIVCECRCCAAEEKA